MDTIFREPTPGIAGVLDALADQLKYRLAADPHDRSAYEDACSRQGVEPVPDFLLTIFWVDDLRAQAIRSGQEDVVAAVLLAGARASQISQYQMLGRLPLDRRQGGTRAARLEALSGSGIGWLAALADELVAQDAQDAVVADV